MLICGVGDAGKKFFMGLMVAILPKELEKRLALRLDKDEAEIGSEGSRVKCEARGRGSNVRLV